MEFSKNKLQPSSNININSCLGGNLDLNVHRIFVLTVLLFGTFLIGPSEQVKAEQPTSNVAILNDLSEQVILDQYIEILIDKDISRSEEHTSELQSRGHLVCRLLLEKKKQQQNT